jgi:hypothetical protein
LPKYDLASTTWTKNLALTNGIPVSQKQSIAFDASLGLSQVIWWKAIANSKRSHLDVGFHQRADIDAGGRRLFNGIGEDVEAATAAPRR